MIHIKSPTLLNVQDYYQAGVSKLNEAKQLVDELKRKAAEQSQLLAEKQSEADQALGQITESMQVCRAAIVEGKNKRCWLYSQILWLLISLL